MIRRFFLSKTNILLTVALLGVVAAITVLSLRLINNDKNNIVPDFYNSSKAEIELWCSSLKIDEPCSFSEQYSDTIEAGNAISQSVFAGEKLNKNSKISFVISLGKELNVSVPEINEDLNKEVLEKWKIDNSLNIELHYIEENNDVIAKGYITAIDPLVITKDINRINIKVSAGTKLNEDGEIEIESDLFIGMKPKMIELKAKELGLAINHNESKDSYSSTTPVGMIVWHGSGTYEKGDEWNYGLSLGPNDEMIIVDAKSYYGKSEKEFIDIVSKLGKEGLVAKHNEDKDDYSDTYNKGFVIWHGSGEYDDGEAITYGLSLGKDSRIKVQDGTYVGLSLEEFTTSVKQLGETGLVPKHVDSEKRHDTYSDTVKKGYVLWHGSGTYENGEEISYILSLGEIPKVNIKNCAGMEENEFISYINSKNCKVGTRKEEYSNDVNQGYIISNRSGDLAEGSQIDYVVSKGKAINVGDYAGKDESVLTSFLSEHGLYYTSSEEYSDSIDAGKIIRNATGNFAKGSTVTYVVSIGPRPEETETIMKVQSYSPFNTSSYNDTVNKLKNGPFSRFNKVTYVGQTSEYTAGVILEIKVNGSIDYSAPAQYPIDSTVIEITISTGQNS